MDPADAVLARIAELEHIEELWRARVRRLASALSHDLRAPIRHVHGFGAIAQEALERDPPDVESALRCVTRMLDAARRADEMATALTRWARQPEPPLELEVVDLADVVSGAIDAAAPDIEAREATIEVGDLPSVAGHGELLAQALGHLIVNAVRFVPPERTPHVEISGGDDGSTWWIAVSDNGDGVPEDERAHVFDLFRWGTNAVDRGGAGAGLAFVRSIVELHGGTVTIGDTAEGGAVLLLAIPGRATTTDT
ncbi:MAG: HAMP domain-containing sensor histidine kinase [Actinomycetota bacterium]|nr:HAMP domain-containing sensor histidine kinase [Actinomycetota bacterium]